MHWMHSSCCTAVDLDAADLVLQLVLAAWINELMLLATRPLPENSLLQRVHQYALHAASTATASAFANTSRTQLTVHLLGRAVLRSISIGWVLLRRLVCTVLCIAFLHHASTPCSALAGHSFYSNVELDDPLGTPVITARLRLCDVHPHFYVVTTNECNTHTALAHSHCLQTQEAGITAVPGTICPRADLSVRAGCQHRGHVDQRGVGRLRMYHLLNDAVRNGNTTSPSLATKVARTQVLALPGAPAGSASSACLPAASFLCGIIREHGSSRRF
jgi:hypothetical protein